ncbi:MAG: hypothetical protein ABSE53_02870, partial [Terracidiphilus sp.]
MASRMRPSYTPCETARTKGGGARRQVRQSVETVGLADAAMASPQRAQTGPLWTGNSDQQTGQIGTEESCGRGEPQRAQEDGSRA